MGWTSCRITSVRKRSAIGPLLHFDLSTKAPADILSGTNRTLRFYSDGSHKSRGSFADMLTGGLTTSAGGALVSYNSSGQYIYLQLNSKHASKLNMLSG